MTPVTVVMAWSGGKDSALALHELKSNPNYSVAALLTTVTEGYDRISMHGVRRALLRRQADAIGLPLEEVVIPQKCENTDYEAAMDASLKNLRQRFPPIDAVAFGDLFLEDVRRYRLEKLAPTGLKALFPLWGRPTATLAKDFLRLGFKTVLACVDTKQLDGSFAGREYDEQLLKDLRPPVDPCGENGEFHSFCYDGPIFSHPVAFKRGAVVLRDNRFNYCDLVEA